MYKLGRVLLRCALRWEQSSQHKNLMNRKCRELFLIMKSGNISQKWYQLQYIIVPLTVTRIKCYGFVLKIFYRLVNLKVWYTGHCVSSCWRCVKAYKYREMYWIISSEQPTRGCNVVWTLGGPENCLLWKKEYLTKYFREYWTSGAGVAVLVSTDY